ncbi:sulfatase family protein [Wenyingzhuangia sp. IMCC45467]
MFYLKNTILILLCLVSVNCTSQKKETKNTNKKPNVLIIYPDQLRRYSAGFWSEDQYKDHVIGKPDPVLTPNIDRLAKNGVVFTNAISNFPLCSPARGMLLSGRYPEQNGIWNNCRVGRTESLREDIPTITNLFYQSGYTTAYFGKCHWQMPLPLFDENGNYVNTTDKPGGHYVNQYDTYVPKGAQRHQIEYFYQALKDEHFNPHIYSNDPLTIHGKKDGEIFLPKIFSPKNESEKIIDYLKNTHQQRDEKKPFFMMWAINPPHNPWDDKNTDMDVLRNDYDVDKYPNVDSTLVVRKNVDYNVAEYARHYYANVTSTDAYIGKVINQLEKMNLLDNTIIIFSSDHGEMLGSHGLEGKNVVELESVSVPFIVHWPKGLKADINNILLNVPDVLPTTMGLAGLENKIPKEVEGTNYADLLKNPNTSSVKKPEASLIMLNKSRGILTHQYTLCVEEKNNQSNSFIYDNVNDPYQLTKINLKELPKVSQKLLTLLGSKLKETNDPWYQNKKLAELIIYP